MKHIDAIVSAYYCAPWLENRIKNLLDQDRVPRIYAMAKSGSEESAILSRFPQVITVLSHDVPTVYETWNDLIDCSTGDYIMIANSDDRLAKSATSEMAAVLDEDPSVGLVYGDFYVVNEEFGDPVIEMELREPDVDLRDGCYIGHYPMWRRSINLGKFNTKYKIAADYDMWLRFQKNGVKFHHIQKPLARFWDRGDNLEFRYNNRLIWESARIRRDYEL